MAEKIAKYDFKPDLTIGFEVVDVAELYKYKQELIVKPHRTGFYHIIWIEKGETIHMVDFHPVYIKEQTLLFLNKDVVQRFSKDQQFEGTAILFTEEFFVKSELDSRFLRDSLLFNNLFEVSKVELATSEMLAFYGLLDLMKYEEQKVSGGFHQDILKNLLLVFLLQAEQALRNSNLSEVKRGPDQDYVTLLMDLLDRSFKHQKMVTFYASELSVTEKRLNAATGKILGKTVKQVIDGRVMLEAKRLLAHTNESIKEIGYSLGFEEPTNFIKYFKKHNLSTPVEFREATFVQ